MPPGSVAGLQRRQRDDDRDTVCHPHTIRDHENPGRRIRLLPPQDHRRRGNSRWYVGWSSSASFCSVRATGGQCRCSWWRRCPSGPAATSFSRAPGASLRHAPGAPEEEDLPTVGDTRRRCASLGPVLPTGADGLAGEDQRSGRGRGRPLPHHRTCGPASGGSSGRRIETLPGLAQGLQAEAVPVGVGQAHLEDPGSRNPPAPLATAAHLRALLSERARIRRLCRLAAVVFHSWRKRRRS
jgi:hypothetical protein